MIECESRKDGETIKAILLFSHEELIYDISNLAYVEGHILPDIDPEIVHTLQDITQEGNKDRVERILDKAHAILTELLYPFTKREITKDVLDNRLRERKVLGIVLELPEDFSQTTLNVMERLVHEYLVADVIQDWLSITVSNTQKAEVWKEKREEAKRKLRLCVNQRRGIKRTRLKPHWL